jgi:hypothetical protein
VKLRLAGKHHFTSLSDNNGNNNMENPVLAQYDELRACELQDEVKLRRKWQVGRAGSVKSLLAVPAREMLPAEASRKTNSHAGLFSDFDNQLQLKGVFPRTGLVSGAPIFTRKLTMTT